MDGWTILVCWKVFEGFLKVFEGCKQQSYKIFEAVEDRNPMSKMYIGTPLHIAAMKGDFDICKLVIDNIQDKNPGTLVDPGRTPLFWATVMGHHQIADYIKSKIEN